ncbi:MAG: hypothetical protein K2X38_03515 [Gemmataceae bacterium]|nr:hypothetical protein [Gemmataceae bacterium]
MSLENQVLEKLADAGSSAAPKTIVATDGPWTIEVHAQKADEFSVMVDAVEVRRDAPADGDAKSWASGIASRPTGLLEPLRLLEADKGKNEAVVRSAQPAKKGDEVRYYEVHVQGGEKAEVHRYKASQQPGAKRETIPFPMTHEALGKLASGLTGE